MLRCWAYQPSERPTFAQCLTEVKDLLVFKEELADIPSFGRFNPTSDPNTFTTNPSTSRDSWKTSGGHNNLNVGTRSTSRGSQATTVPLMREQSVRDSGMQLWCSMLVNVFSC